MYEFYEPGDRVVRSSIYRVSHADGCDVEQEVTCVFGRVFPPCLKCGEEVSFSLVRYAQDVGGHPSFKPLPKEAPAVEKPKNHRKPWTAEDLERLRSLLGERRTPAEVADLLGRSEEAIILRTGMLKIQSP